MATIHAPYAVAPAADAEFSISIRTLLAGLSVAAGAIHLAMVGSHAEASAIDGLQFALAGWFQFVLAFWLFARPSRWPLIVNLVVNVGLIVAWAVSRTVGLPWGAHAGIAEEVGRVDLLCVGAEAALVVVSVALLIKPQLAISARGPVVAVIAALPLLAVFGLTTAALASGEVAAHGGPGHSHTHGAGAAGDGHSHDAEDGTTTLAALAGGCDANANVASYYEQVGSGASGHAHGQETQSLVEFANANGITINQTTIDQLSSALGGEPTVVVGGGEHGAGGPFVGLDGHGAPQAWTPLTDPADCIRFQTELMDTLAVGLTHPTVQTALDDGYVRATGYIAGIAAHYIDIDELMDPGFDPSHPEMLLYDGDDPDSRMVGVSYALFSDEVVDPAEYGFTGPNDYPHNHDGLCTRGAQVVGAASISDEECARRGGSRIGADLQMIHAWVVPGCESPYGVFSAENPVMDVALGQHSTEAGSTGCAFSDYDLDTTPGVPATLLTES
jgi:hypothetical protein